MKLTEKIPAGMILNYKKPGLAIFIWLLFSLSSSYAQKIQKDSSKINYKQFYANCLDANVKTAILNLHESDIGLLSAKDSLLKQEFLRRFSDSIDNSDYLERRNSAINDLLKIYHSYWRLALLNNTTKYDSLLMHNVSEFLSEKHIAKIQLVNEDSIDLYLKHYIESLGLHTTGLGKTGKLYDLLVWEKETDTTYSFLVHNERISSRVILMDNFITLGWEEYATIDRYYPGGWATGEALYCVKKGYDLNSERFLISYLAHESRHFADYKIFPKLSSADLEYRAKLTELSMAKNTLYEIISFFINNANYESDNGHSVANYCAIRDLSKTLFKVEFQKDLNEWKKAGIQKINAAAYRVLQINNRALKSKGTGVERYIKTSN